MSDKKNFSNKVKTFFMGERIPVLSEHDLNTIQDLDGKMDSLLTLLGSQRNGSGRAISRQDGQSDVGAQLLNGDQENIGNLATQVRKLAKTQFKANTLQEKQLSQQDETVAGLRQSIEQQEKRLAELAQQRQQAVESGQLDVLKSLLPVLDGLDAAFDNGRRQVKKQPMPAETRQTIIAWLDGVRLARMRLLDMLAAYNVKPIPTVGEHFDPHQHVAVATDSSRRAPDGTVVSEDRRGYATPDKVLRFAEVVVAQSN